MFTFGFYDSLNGDRKYNTRQISQIFDGIIEDGVYANIGEALMVVPGTGLQVIVKTGRAWFKHTWNYNDSYMPLDISDPDQYRNRIDAVVIEVNANLDARSNVIKVIKGTPATTPLKPVMQHEEGIDQYALAYVTIEPAATAITESKIEIAVGKNETPFVQCPLKTVSIEDIFQTWNGEFQEWFENIQSQLEGDIATNLQNQIDQRVKIADKATDEDLASLTPNKWVDADLLGRSGGLSALPVGTFVRSLENLEEKFPGKFVYCDGREITQEMAPELDLTSLVIDYESLSFEMNGYPPCPIGNIVYNDKYLIPVNRNLYVVDIETLTLDETRTITGKLPSSNCLYLVSGDRLYTLAKTSSTTIISVDLTTNVGNEITIDDASRDRGITAIKDDILIWPYYAGNWLYKLSSPGSNLITVPTGYTALRPTTGKSNTVTDGIPWSNRMQQWGQHLYFITTYKKGSDRYAICIYQGDLSGNNWNVWKIFENESASLYSDGTYNQFAILDDQMVVWWAEYTINQYNKIIQIDIPTERIVKECLISHHYALSDLVCWSKYLEKGELVFSNTTLNTGWSVLNVDTGEIRNWTPFSEWTVFDNFTSSNIPNALGDHIPIKGDVILCNSSASVTSPRYEAGTYRSMGISSCLAIDGRFETLEIYDKNRSHSWSFETVEWGSHAIIPGERYYFGYRYYAPQSSNNKAALIRFFRRVPYYYNRTYIKLT